MLTDVIYLMPAERFCMCLQLVMITGDAPLTACHAASRIHILDRPVLIAVHRYLPVRCA